MKYEKLKETLLSYPDSSLSFPFDEITPVFKVAKKMSALIGTTGGSLSINLKCDPEDALILRSQFDAIHPGYHMNKDHWNTVNLDGSIDTNILKKLIDDSYILVVRTMSLREQKRLGVT